MSGGLCVPPVVIGNLVTNSRYGQYFELSDSADSSAAPLRAIMFHAARGACLQGMVPANGMFYTAQNICGCVPGQIFGFLGFGPNGDLPAEKVFGQARPVERGPAFADAKPGPLDTNAWPMHRANSRRNNSTTAPAPGALDVLWQASVAGPNSGPMKAAWDARLAPVITPPVAAGGRVFVASTEAGQVKAFDTATGKSAWTVTLGSRIDSAPTILGNLCVVGSRDGWVYAFTVEKGMLAWRTRVAPVEQRMVVNGRVESTWPAVGSVLVHDGKLLANAGRGTEADGGIAAVQLDPATGKSLWAGVMAPGSKRRIDLLRVAADTAADTIACNQTAIDPTSGISQKRQIKSKSPGGPMLDGYLGWIPRLASYSRTPAHNRAIAKEHVVVAKALPVGGHIQLINRATDKKIIATLKLDAAPIYDALAVAGGKVFVSLEDGRVLCLGNRKLQR